MLRIPNPGSDIDIFVRIFQDLYELLKDLPDFDLDDMTSAMLERNNVSSHGTFGEEALRRSTRADRSRDALYNQSKMYAELYRTLGWIQSTTSNLRFAFSWLGEHAAHADDPRPLTIECLIGMAYPNDVLSVKGTQSIRVFPTILATANSLGGDITRDEMIVGPLSISDDRDETIVKAMVDKLLICRKRKNGIKNEIKKLSVERGITHVTMGNYTRFPIAAIQWAGWARKTSRSTLSLTDEGHATISRLSALYDVRVSDYKDMPDTAKEPFLRLSAHLMLERAGYDITSVMDVLDADRVILKGLDVPTDSPSMFSPFQQIARSEVNAAFPFLVAHSSETVASTRDVPITAGKIGRSKASALLRFKSDGVATDAESDPVKDEILNDLSTSRGSVPQAVEVFVDRHSTDNQDKFYPLIADLFNLIGYECRIARRGVNYDRADAMIVDDTHSIPIEIKSPGEETEISVKAVRQAVENKVILLSRRQFVTSPKTTSLVVGFNAPNERSEVRELIEDVSKTYGINVGVIDLRALTALAVQAVLAGTHLSLTGFIEMKGVVDVENFLTK